MCIKERIFLELKTKVVVNDVYITELEEEKEKVEKEKMKVEELYFKEKQITES